ncbi:MAG: DEAD/DEAH box helicase [Actinomycetes bacterium]
MSVLDQFTPAVADWFARSFEAPTAVQEEAWPAIASGEHTLISAPTGSGKTLAAFLWGLDRIAATPLPDGDRTTRIVYISPLKALSHDVERNLRAPLRGIGGDITVGLRTGDTSQKDRAAMLRNPPDVLITTPESLYLMLTGKAQETLRGVEAVIVDEIHSVAATKRGSHLALSLERLEAGCERAPQRIGLSATQKPLEEIGRFLTGPRRGCRIVDTGVRKQLDVEIRVPVESMVEPDQGVDLDPLEGGEATRRSIWPAMHPELLELIVSHRSTILFVNNRRGAERLALRLNELAEKEVARAHHGSLAREERLVVEELLKSGQIPCIVATSSLELGIDMGAVDLVIQVESPKSVARGLQRIGRAGHTVDGVAKGRIFPKFRGDLLECAVVSKRMTEGLIETTVVPRNALDVLAQQVVAMAVAEEAVAVDEIHSRCLNTLSYSELTRTSLEGVLDMLDGRYPSQDFNDLRPRIIWDRAANVIRPRKGSRLLAVANAGTIPDRGLFTVVLPDGRKVGELDEEMVHEARPGQTFMLGASTWRIEEIGRDRVIVTPAPGVPGAVPFWRGDSIGRPRELGEAIGEFSREAVDRDPSELAADYGLDRRAAKNLVEFLKEQREATRSIPSDRCIVVERFRDEIGDWRLCVLSPFGGRVHAAWGLALSSRLREVHGLESDAIWSDDGIIIHLSDSDEPPGAELVLVEPEELEELIVSELGASALFGARFRENAARSLLIPRSLPGRRTPLWQQRLKSQALLDVARKWSDFPIILETYRECLQDVLDIESARTILERIRTREISLVEVETDHASPFASALLFDYVATYMYEGDQPNAERRAAALSLDRDLLRELLGQDELRELIDPGALEQVEADLQHTSERRRAGSADEVHDLLRRVGDLTSGEIAERVHDGIDSLALIDSLDRDRRAIEVRVGGELRWIAAQDAGLYRDALGVVPPGGVAESHLEPVDEPMRELVLRYAATHGPFMPDDLRDRYGIDFAPALRDLERAGDLIRGEIRPGGSEREWCSPDVLRRIRRASLSVLRGEIEPVDELALARFLPAWQGVDRHTRTGAGEDRLREVLGPLQGLALTPTVWERDVLPRRVGAWSPAWLDSLCASGEVVWIGAGSLGGTGRVMLAFRDEVATIGPPPRKGDPPEGDAHGAIRERLASGACFFTDLIAGLEVGSEELNDALWDLVWAGEVTNDAFAPLRAGKISLAKGGSTAAERRRRRVGRAAIKPQVQGRWSLTAPLFASPATPSERLRAVAELLLERHGVVTRETVLAEGIPGGFSSLYGEFCDLETLGVARRGYFIEGQGGAQFALPGAVERLRAVRADDEERSLLLAATDPAQAWGGQLKWPAREDGRRNPARTAGAFVVTVGGFPIVQLERGGKALTTLVELDDARLPGALKEISTAVESARLYRVALEKVDGAPVVGSAIEPLLIEAGFRPGPRRLVASS